MYKSKKIMDFVLGPIRESSSRVRVGRQHVPQHDDRQRKPVRHHLGRVRRRQDRGRQVHHELFVAGVGVWRDRAEGQGRHPAVQPLVGGLRERQDRPQQQLIQIRKWRKPIIERFGDIVIHFYFPGSLVTVPTAL